MRHVECAQTALDGALINIGLHLVCNGNQFVALFGLNGECMHMSKLRLGGQLCQGCCWVADWKEVAYHGAIGCVS